VFGWCHLFLAQGRALLADNRHAEARAVGERALALAEERGERPQQAYAAKLLGDILAASGDRGGAEAEKHFQRALDLAEQCGMRPLMEGACVALANMAARSGRPDLAQRYAARAAEISQRRPARAARG